MSRLLSQRVNFDSAWLVKWRIFERLSVRGNWGVVLLESPRCPMSW